MDLIASNWSILIVENIVESNGSSMVLDKCLAFFLVDLNSQLVLENSK